MPPTVTMSGAGVIGAAHRMVLRRPPIAARGGVPGRGVQKVAEVQVQVGDRAEIRGEHVWLEGVGAITENDRSGVVRTHAGVLTSVTLGGSVGVGPRRGAIAGQHCARPSRSPSSGRQRTARQGQRTGSRGPKVRTVSVAAGSSAASARVEAVAPTRAGAAVRRAPGVSSRARLHRRRRCDAPRPWRR